MGFTITPNSVSTLSSDGTSAIQGESIQAITRSEFQKAQDAGYAGTEGQFYTKLAEWADMPDLLTLYEASKA